MAEEYSFVEVLMIQYELGDKEHRVYLEDEVDSCFDVFWRNATEEIPEVIAARRKSEENQRRAEEEAKQRGETIWSWHSSIEASAPDLLVIHPFTTFQFKYIGQSLDRNYVSGIEWEAGQLDADYVFKGWLDELKKMGQSILTDKKIMGLRQAKNEVRFITLWSYSSWQDSYYHEWNSEWELIGLVNLKDVALMLKEKQHGEDNANN